MELTIKHISLQTSGRNFPFEQTNSIFIDVLTKGSNVLIKAHYLNPLQAVVDVQECIYKRYFQIKNSLQQTMMPYQILKRTEFPLNRYPILYAIVIVTSVGVCIGITTGSSKVLDSSTQFTGPPSFNPSSFCCELPPCEFQLPVVVLQLYVRVVQPPDTCQLPATLQLPGAFEFPAALGLPQLEFYDKYT